METGRALEELLRSAGALLAEANRRDLTALTDGEIAEATELSAEVAKLAEAAHVRAVGRLDVSRAWADDGSRSGAAWVAWHCHVAMCQLSNGTVVTPGQVLPLLRWADVARVVFDGPSRVIDVGVRQRLFTGATRTAVAMRDRFCQHPGCDVPAERCEIDHVVPYEDGGLTVQANARCYCPFHHRWDHRQRRPAA